MRPPRLLPALASLVALAACAAPRYVASDRARKLAKTMDPADAANLFADSLGRSLRGSGICAAPFGVDDPRPATTMDAFTVQAWRTGEEVGRRQEGGRTVVRYAKVRYAEERRYADVEEVLVSPDAGAVCPGQVPAGQVALSLRLRGAPKPIVVAVAVASLDEVLAALTVLAPRATLVDGAR